MVDMPVVAWNEVDVTAVEGAAVEPGSVQPIGVPGIVRRVGPRVVEAHVGVVAQHASVHGVLPRSRLRHRSDRLHEEYAGSARVGGNSLWRLCRGGVSQARQRLADLQAPVGSLPGGHGCDRPGSGSLKQSATVFAIFTIIGERQVNVQG